jgi:hypothetical protein
MVLRAPRFGLPGHVVAGRAAARTQHYKILAPARIEGKLELSGRFVGTYKLRSYIFTNKWLVKPYKCALMRRIQIARPSDKASHWAPQVIPLIAGLDAQWGLVPC